MNIIGYTINNRRYVVASGQGLIQKVSTYSFGLWPITSCDPKVFPWSIMYLCTSTYSFSEVYVWESLNDSNSRFKIICVMSSLIAAQGIEIIPGNRKN